MTSSALWMERLRSKSAQFKSLTEQSKIARAALLERRYGLDIEEKGALRNCLDHLSEAIPVRDALSMSERLEAIARKITAESGGTVNLSFMAAQVRGCFYLSTEMFYVEINIDSSGRVNEAKVHHIDPSHSNQQLPSSKTCPEIIECLSMGNFPLFVEHLLGLISVYNLPDAVAVDKTRVWNALNLLEHEMEEHYESYRNWKTDTNWLLHQTDLGILRPRAGGMPMKLRYFMAPHELLDESAGKLMPFTPENVVKHDLGLWVTIGVEKSPTPKFLAVREPTQQMDHSDIPHSVALPARFVMKLSQPMPMCLAKCREIAKLTEIEFYSDLVSSPLFQLITKTSTKHKIDSANNKGLFVHLPPDDHHCYILTDAPEMNGVLVTSIPFISHTHVFEILKILRQQALFNTIVGSCVRSCNNYQELDKVVMFEVASRDLQQLAVTFEVLKVDSTAMVNFDLTDICNIRCWTYVPETTTTTFVSQEKASTLMQRTLSLPVTMRSILKQSKCRIKSDPESESTSTASALNGNIRDPNQNFSTMDFSISRNGDIKPEPMDFEVESGAHLADPLNQCGPQDVTFNPGASATTLETRNDWGASLQSRPGQDAAKRNHFDGSNKTISCPEIKIEASSPSPSPKMANYDGKMTSYDGRKDGTPSKTSVTVKVPVSGARSGYKSTVSTTTTTAKTNHKSSVSILPVSSADSPVTPPSSGLKKGCGIEIIPLDVVPSDSMDSKMAGNKNWSKEVRRSLSEDDKRKFERKDGSNSKKRKHEMDRQTFSGHKKSSSPGSPNSKRQLIGSSEKSKSKSSSSNPPSKIELSTGFEGSTSGIEILPANSATSSNSGSSPPSKSSSSSSKDRSKSESPGLKLTIKNSASASSSSKHRSEHYHKSSEPS